MAEVELSIAGRTYRVGCRDGEEENLRAAGALVDSKSREALSGLGALSEARQLLFASLLIADQLIEKKGPEAVPPPQPPADPMVARRVEALADRIERLADNLEQSLA
ncbi:cell division protein ZapA [Sphingomonas ginkgonis]|uniref:Cell division protein ZapA n=1 Tax=Sphingomonas ginkgonis TaxID=2315330 RepID=A0A3R9WP12_9SPHN|nr:cell division protein ZapA [Sphingomonas ginkgonis]RST30930.1 cell division protein ZapA [Sphingomonas ginkgonis]